ncbi:carbohydrate-binding protein [Micromonospora sp. KC606]|uniref:poly(ethylene terephthalate) hydrolase family protein n=1 Tax=Micromonospora sp. KC606 TaxID=2530379 RepID=UPI001050C126|nr:carbohydrate-binding protein [Micromonospora sp. KC606]TDC82176.1 carbohydrate-binding protein [Micromonospora sp. KC606]
MPYKETDPQTSGNFRAGRLTPRRTGLLGRRIAVATAALFATAAVVVAVRPALAADNPYQRGPNPTAASVAASRGTFATTQVNVPAGNGFGGGVIYYPTDTSQGRFGAVAIVPGYTATWAAEGAWMGPWLASFGFVVIGIDTNSRNDWDTARGQQLLAALDYLTQRSSVRDRVDASRAAVMGHSMGGGGAMYAALQRPSLKAAVGLAPFSPSQSLNNMRVPTMLLAGQNDGTTTPASILNHYNAIPAASEKAYLELAGADHGFPTSNNPTMMRNVIPWLKIFTDSDTRYTQFLCPLSNWSGIRAYQSSCPLVPSPVPTTSPTASPPSGQRYEAEDAPAVCQGTIDSNHAGFSGSGFCNGTGAVGAYAQFTVNTSAAGTAALGVRFANGASGARSANLVVNGTTVATVSFESTGAWSTWVTKNLTASLNAGSNTIRLSPTVADGLPNIDYLTVGAA